MVVGMVGPMKTSKGGTNENVRLQTCKTVCFKMILSSGETIKNVQLI